MNRCCWAVEAAGPAEGPCVTESYYFQGLKGVFSNPLTGLDNCHGVSRKGKSLKRGKPASPPPGLEQDKEWERLMSGRLSVSWDHKKEVLLLLQDTNFYGSF